MGCDKKKSRQNAKKQAQKEVVKVSEKDYTTKVIDGTNPIDKAPDESNKAIADFDHSNQSDENLEDETNKLFETPANVSNDTIDHKTIQPETSESYTFKSDDPRFLVFPERFEDQKKDAYDNYFKLYLQKSLKVYN